MSKSDKPSKLSIYAIAKVANVSPGTVSKVINQRGNISPATITRVREAIYQFNYIPQQRKQSGNSIGVLLCGEGNVFNDIFASQILGNICECAFARGYDITLLDGHRFIKSSPSDFYCYCTGNSLSGLIVYGLPQNNPLELTLRRSEMPFLILTSDIEECNFVTCNNYESTCELVSHLIDLGCRRIAYLGCGIQSFGSHRERFKGYCDTLERNGIARQKEYEIECTQFNLPRVLTRLFSRRQPPDAIFFASETLSHTPQLLQDMNINLDMAGFCTSNDSTRYSVAIQPLRDYGICGVDGIVNLVTGTIHSLQKRLPCQLFFAGKQTPYNLFQLRKIPKSKMS